MLRALDLRAALARAGRVARRALIPAGLGALAFLVITGGRILQPTNIAWLAQGDPATYFLGWHFFRHTPWTFPLGLNPRYGAELGGSLALVDNVPLFAILFKTVGSLLPEFFQYFGVWMLLCFVLQGCFAWLLVGLVTRAPVLRAAGTSLFVLAPPFVWRLQGHYAMEGQWFLLAALYLCFEWRIQRRALLWLLLAFAASTVHSYITAMVLGLWLSDWLRRALFGSRARMTWIELAAVPTSVAVGFWQIGLFVLDEGIATTGFGNYRMNLLSLVDPSGWSYVLPDLPEGPGDYEGFNYLGLGGILLALAALPALRRAWPALRARREYWPLAVLLVLLTLYAVSNRIGLADATLEIPLPQALIDRANMLRCSGRMFWLVYYVLLWFLLRTLFRSYSPRVAAGLLLGATALQVVDTSAGWRPIRSDLMVVGGSWPSPLKTAFWQRAPEVYRELRLVPPSSQAPNYETFAYYAATHGLATDAVYFARVDTGRLERAKRDAMNAVRKAQYTPGALYVLAEREATQARETVDARRDLLSNIDGVWVLAPDWKCRPECRAGGAGDREDCASICSERAAPRRPADKGRKRH